MASNAAELLRSTRLRHGLSQRRLAGLAWTKQSVISRIEGGKVSPTVGALSRLLEAMGEELVLDTRVRMPPSD